MIVVQPIRMREMKNSWTKQILSVLSFAEAMRLISDIKNDHFEPINFIQVSWLRTFNDGRKNGRREDEKTFYLFQRI